MARLQIPPAHLGTWSLAAGLVAYALGVMHRTSFGVATPQAESHFATTATTLSMFVVVQLIVYAACQIPVGVALDRWGARLVITAGSLAMALGQLVLAFTDVVSVAIIARGVMGAGDACLFISVVRLLPAWFAPHRIPLLTQVISMIGQSGQFLSAVPFLAVLHQFGWQVSFLSAGIAGLAATVFAGVVIRNGATDPKKSSDPAARLLVRSSSSFTFNSVLKEPGSWLAFWSHWITSFTPMVTAFMWAVPFFTAGHKLSTAATSVVLLASPLSSIIGGFVIGKLSARFPGRRSWLVLLYAFVSLFAWVAVLAVNKPLPAWVLMIWLTSIAMGGPTSLIAFDYTRQYNTPRRLGKATGFTNTAGFIAAVTSIFAIGAVLDAVAPGGMTTYSLADFRIAFSVMAIPWLIGVIGVIWSRNSTRKLMAEYGVLIAPARERLRALARIRRMTQDEV